MKNNITKEEFCNKYGQIKDGLYRYALYRLGNSEDAEDAVSDTVLAAWQGIGKLRNTEAFNSWIYSILARICNSYIKKTIKNREKLEKAKVSAETLGELSGNSNTSGSLSSELAEALSILNDEERSIVLLSVLGGMNSREISENFDLTAGAVRSKLSRSLAKMREYLS
ncbi:MAG: RNA polymerase sigma factor [Mogibacterium sp.]|nr:RNA polymerase sigma factor [Mogibacterium sp.]